jgi:hypothetical protein
LFSILFLLSLLLWYWHGMTHGLYICKYVVLGCQQDLFVSFVSTTMHALYFIYLVSQWLKSLCLYLFPFPCKIVAYTYNVWYTIHSITSIFWQILKFMMFSTHNDKTVPSSIQMYVLFMYLWCDLFCQVKYLYLFHFLDLKSILQNITQT